MSPLEKLSDKALLLLMNQIREEFVDNDIDFYGIEEFFSNYNIIATKHLILELITYRFQI
jgi:hypothetical protein